MDTQTEKPQLEIEDEAPATVHGTYFQHVSQVEYYHVGIRELLLPSTMLNLFIVYNDDKVKDKVWGATRA